MMKKLALLFLTLVVVTLWSCDDDVEERPVVAMQQLPVLDAPFGSTYVLTSDNATALVETFTWDEAVYTESVSPEYTLEIDFSGNNFSTFQELGSTTDNKLSITVEALNNVLLALEAVPFAENLFELRLRVNLGTMDPDYAEEVYTLTITPYSDAQPTFRELFLIGDATAAGSDNDNNNTPLFRDPSNEDIYYFRGYFVANEFNLIEVKGESYPLWGTNDGATLAVNEGTGVDPNGFVIPATGYYDFEVNLSEATFSLAPNGDAMVEYPTIGVLGNGTNPEDVDGDGTPDGWQSDIDMTQAAFDPHLWYANGIILYDGEIKFRANDDWAVNWGGNTELSGQGTFDGPNVPVNAGTY
ncbi:MAG: SusE domain-containing protein, partial [Bacteroidota bacterium]